MIHIGKTPKVPLFQKVFQPVTVRTFIAVGTHCKEATKARNYSQCDSLLFGDKCGAHTWPLSNATINRPYSNTKHLHPKYRRSIVLLPPAGDKHRKCHRVDCKRLCQRRVKTPSHEFAVEAQNCSTSAWKEHRIKYYFQYK
jgi:hypothetical protein